MTRLWRKSLASLAAVMKVPQPSPVAVQNTVIPLGQSIATGSSPKVFSRMYSVHGPIFPQLPFELHKENLKLEEEIDEDQSKKEKEMGVKRPEDEIKNFTDVYNTSQKILIGCVWDFAFALDIASSLGDARNIVIMSPKSFCEMKSSYEDAWSHMLHLSNLGATLVFDVDLNNFKEDSRINHTVYDAILLDMSKFY